MEVQNLKTADYIPNRVKKPQRPQRPKFLLLSLLLIAVVGFTFRTHLPWCFLALQLLPRLQRFIGQSSGSLATALHQAQRCHTD